MEEIEKYQIVLSSMPKEKNVTTILKPLYPYIPKIVGQHPYD